MFVSGLAVFCGCSLWLAGCSSSAEERKPETELESARDIQDGTGLEDTLAVVNFDHELDGYEPLKKEYILVNEMNCQIYAACFIS